MISLPLIEKGNEAAHQVNNGGGGRGIRKRVDCDSCGVNRGVDDGGREAAADGRGGLWWGIIIKRLSLLLEAKI